MDGLNLNHPLFTHLINEHKKIVLYLNNLRLTDSGVLNQLNWLWENAEMSHHKKEEILLFSTMAEKSRIAEGGPLCTLYFDLHMSDPPTDKCYQLIGVAPTIEPHQQELIAKNSPLRIPLDEHRSGKEILQFLISHWSTLEDKKKEALVEQYKTLSLQHIHKEESCFFHLCSDLLTIDEASLILERWQMS